MAEKQQAYNKILEENGSSADEQKLIMESLK